MAKKNKWTPKRHVQCAEPTARLDYYELLMGQGKPCWFIREGLQGPKLSAICATPRAAWRNAYDGLMASFKRSA